MEDQIELFIIPPVAGSPFASRLSPLAIAAILEANLACDRAEMRSRGRVDFIRFLFRSAWDSPFSNCRELCPEITRVLKGYDEFPPALRAEAERLRPAAAERIAMKLRQMLAPPL